MILINKRIQIISKRLNISIPQIESFLPLLIIRESDTFRIYNWVIWHLSQPNVFEKIILSKDQYITHIVVYCIQSIHRIERHSRNKKEDFDIIFSSLEALKSDYFDDLKKITIRMYEELLTYFDLDGDLKGYEKRIFGTRYLPKKL